MCCLHNKWKSLQGMTQMEMDMLAAEMQEVRRRARLDSLYLTRREIVATWVGEDGEPRSVDPQSPDVLRQVEEIVRLANERVPA